MPYSLANAQAVQSSSIAANFLMNSDLGSAFKSIKASYTLYSALLVMENLYPPFSRKFASFACVEPPPMREDVTVVSAVAEATSGTPTVAESLTD